MLFANWLDDLLKDFIHHVSNAALEGFVFLGRSSMLNRPDGVVHLAVDAKEYLENVLGNFFVLKQVLLRGLSYVDPVRIIAYMPD
jgi:hypothetical protein